MCRYEPHKVRSSSQGKKNLLSALSCNQSFFLGKCHIAEPMLCSYDIFNIGYFYCFNFNPYEMAAQGIFIYACIGKYCMKDNEQAVRQQSQNYAYPLLLRQKILRKPYGEYCQRNNNRQAQKNFPYTSIFNLNFWLVIFSPLFPPDILWLPHLQPPVQPFLFSDFLSME